MSGQSSSSVGPCRVDNSFYVYYCGGELRFENFYVYSIQLVDEPPFIVVKFWTTTLIYKSSSTMCRCRGEFNLRVGMQDLNLAILLFLAVKGLAWVRQVSDRCQKSV